MKKDDWQFKFRLRIYGRRGRDLFVELSDELSEADSLHQFQTARSLPEHRTLFSAPVPKMIEDVLLHLQTGPQWIAVDLLERMLFTSVSMGTIASRRQGRNPTAPLLDSWHVLPKNKGTFVQTMNVDESEIKLWDNLSEGDEDLILGATWGANCVLWPKKRITNVLKAGFLQGWMNA